MIPLSLHEIAAAVGGEVHDDPAGVTVSGPAFQDTRAPEPGGLYVAFVGAHVDGHDLAGDAVGAGASAVLGSRPVGVPAVVVDDVQAALGLLARHLLARLPGVTVLAVTGSQGKTSTKDLLAAVLSANASTVATRGSFNNEIGLPLTVLRADVGTRYLLLEMGARGIGHLTTLCQVAPPDVSLVLNVGKAHLGEFGTQADIAVAKGELVEALAEDGVAVLNADDPLVAAMARRTRGRVLTFGTGEDADVRLADVRLDAEGRPEMTITHGGRPVALSLRLVGEHQARNAAAAVAAAAAVGIPVEDACRILSGVESLSQWRMEVHRREDGLTLVNDAYNANPDSMEAALRALAAIGRGRGGAVRTVAVLGEMRELGESAPAEHEAVGRLAVRLGVHRLVVVGDAARAVHQGALLEGAQGEDAVLVADNDEAVRWLGAHAGPDDVVLVKASRGARLDVVADALLRASGTEDAR
ncbi:MAG TPA: UDP-N-acetylmuramoyl-tripeptide--D-alanyl-D-alanine ligase [Marmoricola sp.]|nr:UDP-N-acetylmuramoyl-tripeptide--D-alanyl-D-alanine ligase [Marmoricola sp.]